MSAVWIMSMAGLWLAVIFLTVLVLLLYRQFGLAYLSGRARAGMQGLDLGARARPVALTALDGGDVEIDWSRPLARDGATVLVFALPSCPPHGQRRGSSGSTARQPAGRPAPSTARPAGWSALPKATQSIRPGTYRGRHSPTWWRAPGGVRAKG